MKCDCKHATLVLLLATFVLPACGGEVEPTTETSGVALPADAGDGDAETDAGMIGPYDCFCTGAGSYQVRPPSAALCPTILADCKARCE